MASSQAFVNSIVSQLSLAGDVRSRSMFGEYVLYCDDKVVALICDDQLFMKITPASGQYLDSSHNAPPYPGAKNSLRVPLEKLHEMEWLNSFVRDTANALPMPKKKKR